LILVLMGSVALARSTVGRRQRWPRHGGAPRA
jgi:hypothetical protein